jgi:hypothetical protein
MKFDLPDPFDPIKTLSGLKDRFSIEAMLLKPRIVIESSAVEGMKWLVEKGIPAQMDTVHSIHN